MLSCGLILTIVSMGVVINWPINHAGGNYKESEKQRVKQSKKLSFLKRLSTLFKSFFK